jgi:hypothetical protein
MIRCGRLPGQVARLLRSELSQAQEREVGHVHRLADQASADHGHPLAIRVCGHATKPIEQVAP